MQDKRLLYAAEQQEHELACKCVTVTYQETALWEVIPGKYWDITYQLVQSGLQGQVSLFSNSVMHFWTGDLIRKDPCQRKTVPCMRAWRRVAGASITNIFPATVTLCSLFFLLGKNNCYPNYFLFFQVTHPGPDSSSCPESPAQHREDVHSWHSSVCPCCFPPFCSRENEHFYSAFEQCPAAS